ncbi:MAG: hypothetical protein K2G35_06490 [Duncaniella sp.]|nr:hypothetical protein [Duncaniella sp.]
MSSGKPFLSRQERVGLLALLVVLLAILLFRVADVKLRSTKSDAVSAKTVAPSHAADSTSESVDSAINGGAALESDTGFVEFATSKPGTRSKRKSKRKQKRTTPRSEEPDPTPRKPLDEIL